MELQFGFKNHALDMDNFMLLRHVSEIQTISSFLYAVKKGSRILQPVMLYIQNYCNKISEYISCGGGICHAVEAVVRVFCQAALAVAERLAIRPI